MVGDDTRSMETVYRQMWQHAWPLINSNQVSLDPFLNGKSDTRRGITLLARITPPVSQTITAFMADMQRLEPEQYYYPPSDLHVTVMSILSCHADYQLPTSDKPKYGDLLQNIVAKTPCFNIEFKGITLADSGVLICGYVADDSLAELRTELRTQVGASDLSHSMDQRYTLVTAHNTVVRFRAKLQKTHTFAAFLQANRERYFGKLEVTQLELVVNDWYQSKANTELLTKINLSKP
jgi:2'-5' RNA ligase